MRIALPLYQNDPDAHLHVYGEVTKQFLPLIVGLNKISLAGAGANTRYLLSTAVRRYTDLLPTITQVHYVHTGGTHSGGFIRSMFGALKSW